MSSYEGIFSTDWSRRSRRFRRTSYTLIFASEGLALIFFDPSIMKSPGAIWLWAGAAAVLAFFIPGSVFATAEGLQRPRNFRPDLVIPWEDLDHYEVHKGELGIFGLGVTDIYYFHTRDGRTVRINEWSQDMNDLLRTIGQHKSLPELPFHSR